VYVNVWTQAAIVFFYEALHNFPVRASLYHRKLYFLWIQQKHTHTSAPRNSYQ